MRTSQQIIDQIQHERYLILTTGGDVSRLPAFDVSFDEYRVLCASTDQNITRFTVETELKRNEPRPFMGRALRLAEHRQAP